jgi:hypothetical protein
MLLHYEHGGRGHSYAVVVLRQGPQGDSKFLWAGVGFEPAKGLDDLRRKIADGQFSDDRPYY